MSTQAITPSAASSCTVQYHTRTRAFVAKDTWELVEQLARFLNSERRKKAA